MDDDELTVLVKTEMGRLSGDLSAGFSAAKLKMGDLSARLTDVEQKLVRKGGGGGNADDGATSFGALVETGFAENADLFKKTKSISFVIETKTLTSGPTGAHGSGPVPVTPGMSGALLYDLIAPGDLAGLAVLNYPKRTGTSGGASVQDSEGALKSAAEPIFSPVAQNAATIAGYASLSEQALSTSGGLQRAVNSHLSRSIRLAADALLIGGTTATAWPFGGFAAAASPYAGPATFTSLADAVLAGALHMRMAGFNPGVVVLNESGFLHTMLAKSSTGEYLLENYLSDLSYAMGGMRIALSEGIPAGKAMLADLAYNGFLSSGATRISMGYVNDQFIRNMVTIKAECEVLPFATDYEALLMVTPALA